MTKRHRRHSTAKKREIVEAYLKGKALHALSKQHDVCRNLIRVWIEKYERGEYDDDAVEADLLPEYEARIAALERLAGKQALEIGFFLKGGSKARTIVEKRAWVRDHRPDCISIQRGCDLMNLPRSTFYADTGRKEEDPVVSEIKMITETCRGYGYRRVTAELRHARELEESPTDHAPERPEPEEKAPIRCHHGQRP